LKSVKKLDFDGNPNTLIFFATDEGDFFKIDKANKKIEFRTASGDFIKVDKNGNIDISTMESSKGEITINCKSNVIINAKSVEITHIGSGTVIPKATGGPFNCLKFDPMTGVPHQGTKVINT